jgi:hypothetical protein
MGMYALALRPDHRLSDVEVSDMSETEESTLRAFAEYMRAQATHIRYAAGMNGSHTDGGASGLECSVDVFLAGIARRIPDVWKEEWKTFVGEEYQTYLKLHEKHGKNPKGMPLR